MKNGKFNPLFETIYNRFTDGAGFLAGDVVKLKDNYESLDCYKNLGENVKQCIKDIIKSKNNIRIGKLHNDKFSNSYGAMGGDKVPATLADCYEEVAPSFWRNLVTIPVECLEQIDTGMNLPPVPDNQKDKDRISGPEDLNKHKANKGADIDEQTKIGKKQNHAKGGDYKLATKNTQLAHSNKYDDKKPSKVKGLVKVKEVNEAFSDPIANLYTSMFTEDVGAMGQSSPSAPDSGDNLSGNPHIQSEIAFATKHMTIDEFVQKHGDQIEQQEEILAKDNPSLEGDELTQKAAHMVAAKIGVEIIADSEQ